MSLANPKPKPVLMRTPQTLVQRCASRSPTINSWACLGFLLTGCAFGGAETGESATTGEAANSAPVTRAAVGGEIWTLADGGPEGTSAGPEPGGGHPAEDAGPAPVANEEDEFDLTGLFGVRARITVDVATYVTEDNVIERKNQQAELIMVLQIEHDGRFTKQKVKTCAVTLPTIAIGEYNIGSDLNTEAFRLLDEFPTEGEFLEADAPGTVWDPPEQAIILGADPALGFDGTLPFRADKPLVGTPKCADGTAFEEVRFITRVVEPICHADKLVDTDQDKIPGIRYSLSDTPMFGNIDAYIAARIRVNMNGVWQDHNSGFGQVEFGLENQVLAASKGGDIVTKVSPIITPGEHNQYEAVRIDGAHGTTKYVSAFGWTACEEIKKKRAVLFP